MGAKAVSLGALGTLGSYKAKKFLEKRDAAKKRR